MLSSGYNSGVEDGNYTMMFIILAAVGILVALIMFDQVFNEPYRQSGFEGQVQGLVAEYCSAPREVDRSATRVQLTTLIASKPKRSSKMPSELENLVNNVSDDKFEETCR